MSSESYHLRIKNQAEGIELLRKAKKNGFVFEENNGWVTIILDNKELIPCNELINVNSNYMLYFIDAEDNGCVFTLFKGNSIISNYSVIFSKDTIIASDKLNIDGLYTFIKEVNDKYDKDALLKQFTSIDKYDLYHETISEKTASIFKIDNFKGISYKKLLSGDNENILKENIKYINTDNPQKL